MSTSAPKRRRSPLVVTAAILAVLVAIFFQFSAVFVDVLWYQQSGYQSVLFTQWFAMGGVAIVTFVFTVAVTWLALWLGYKFRPLTARLTESAERYREAVEPIRRLIVWGGPILLGFFTAATSAAQWPVVLQFLNKTPFGHNDPQFGLDISFFVYDLPFWLFATGVIESVLVIALVATALTGFLYGGIAIAGRQFIVSRAIRIQASIVAIAYLAVLAGQFWLKQYEALVNPSQGFVATGAGYTEVNVDIPGYQILAGIAAVVLVFFAITAVTGRWRLPIVGVAMLLVSVMVLGGVSWIVQRFQVDPSARTLESDYIARNIDGTRAGFGLSDVNEVEYTATTTAEAGALRADAETTAHIRIIDPALVPDAFAQLEQFRQYYKFPTHLDVDRYTIDGNKQDTVLAVRELNAAGLTSSTWYNDHIVYTHGYGIVAAYGNKRNVDGQPTFLESGIPVSGNLGEYEPRVYFGENSTDYSIVGAKSSTGPLELDYPSANSTSDSGNAKYTFTGDGGPKLDNIFTRLIYAMHFQSEQILLSDAISNDSQILYDRHPLVRVNKVAPYLTLDNDPYPAVVDGRIVWVVDGYTTSNNYPYSTSVDMGEAVKDTYTANSLVPTGNVNYIRNSVKATVDAYDGSVTLYAWDANDPILATWQKIFPTTLKPASEMSEQLLSHVRYPSDLFKVQREVLGSYHVTDPGTFYSTEDTWVTPNDPVSDPNAPTLQPPYYLTMQMPGEKSPSFSIYSTFIPKSTGKDARNVLYGYLAANSDYGPDYGKLTLLTLPKQTTIPGPGQVQAQFDSDATVSQQLNLLRQGKTEVIPGNLLTLPVGGGLLYVQPVYVRSTGETSYPLLRKILVAFGDSIAFEDSLDAALDSLFGGNSGVVTPTEPTDPTDPSTGGTVSAELAKALADAKKALTDREAAYAKNDLVAAAAADVRLQKALQTAYELSR
ncbi:MAG: hypothetical protein RLZ72_852 [Actinomycetota bacterium]